MVDAVYTQREITEHGMDNMRSLDPFLVAPISSPQQIQSTKYEMLRIPKDAKRLVLCAMYLFWAGNLVKCTLCFVEVKGLSGVE